MKKIILICLSLLACTVYATESQTFSISLSPLSFLSLLAGSQENNVSIDDIWMSLSLNVGSNKKENDFFITKYPHILNIGIEQRNFLKDNFSGFFYGPFISFDYSKLILQDKKNPGYTTNKYENETVYSLLGPRIGEAIGYRFKIKSIGVTPKIGIGIPLYYLFGLSDFSNTEIKKIYIKNMALNCFFLGLKIDLEQ